MKKFLIICSALMLIFLAACSKKTEEAVERDLLKEEWTEIEPLAHNTEVRMFMWGGDEGINRYIDLFVAPKMKEKYGITLVRTPLDINEVLQKLMTEKKADYKNGTMDIIWLNGENFANAKTNHLLWDSFSSSLPNWQNYIDETQFLFDFGTPVDHYQAPWGRVQFVFYYDSEKVTEPPNSFSELRSWIEQNPGKFTYPEASDFTGNAFLRHLLYEYVDESLLLGDSFQKDILNEATVPVWNYLNQIKPNLWREGKTYPQSLAHLDQLYSQGEVYMTMGYNEARAESFIEKGAFPATTKSFILDLGSIGNTHFLSIPFNSPNKAGALVAINELLSPEAQLAKMDRSMWGENTVLSFEKLRDEERQSFDSIERGSSVLSMEVLEQSFLQELNIEYVEWLKENWLVEVVQKNSNES